MQAAQGGELAKHPLPVQTVGVREAAGHNAECVQVVNQFHRALVGSLDDRLKQGAADRHRRVRIK